VRERTCVLDNGFVKFDVNFNFGQIEGNPLWRIVSYALILNWTDTLALVEYMG